MAIRNIVLEGDLILTKKCRDVTDFGERLHQMMDDLRDTMYKIGAIGLAGPHIGILRRIIAMDIGDGFIEICNPEIIDQIGIQKEREGSVSSPGQYFITQRPMIVKVKGQDRYGRFIEVHGKGLKARTLCHEIDQTNGIFFKSKVIDRVN